MSIYDDMARDGGYRGDQAAEVAHMLEQNHKAECEACQRCDLGDDDAPCTCPTDDDDPVGIPF